MAPAQNSHDDYQIQQESALYSSLCLLEGPSGEGAKQVELSKTMFRKQNLKSFEFIINHSCSIVKGKAAAKKFLKWPYADKDPKQKKEFYTNATAWLKECGALEAHGNSLESFKRNPQGPKLVGFLLDLVTYAMSVQQERMFPEEVVPQTEIPDTQLLLLLSEPLLTAIKAQNQLQLERVLKALKDGSGLQQQSEQIAGRLSDLYYSLKAQLAQAQAQADIATAAAGQSVQQVHSGMLNRQSSRSSQQQSVMQLPEQLMQQYSELKVSLSQLEQHMQLYDGLSELMNGLSGSDIHPHAIDAVKLRQCGQLPLAPSTAGLDIAAMMEAWLVDVGAVCRYIKYLAGLPESPVRSTAHSSLGGSPRPDVTPLVATGDASSHAPHLYAQLALHQKSLDQMKGLRTEMGARMAATAEHIQQLEEELYGLIALEEQACLAALEPAHTQFEFAQLTQQQPSAATAAAPALHGVPVSLFKTSNLPLVPTTPMLQQLVKPQKIGQQQQSAASPAAIDEAGSPHMVPRLSFGDSVVDQPSTCSSPRVSAAAVAAQDDVTSSTSTASSTAMPAAALLMSHEYADDEDLKNREYDDLDLVDLGDSDDDLVVPSHTVANKRLGGLVDFDPMRMSTLHVFGGRMAPETTPAPAEPHCTDEDGQTTAQPSSTGIEMCFSWFGKQPTAGQATDQSEADTPPHIGARHQPSTESLSSNPPPGAAVAPAGGGLGAATDVAGVTAAEVLQQNLSSDSAGTTASRTSTIGPMAADVTDSGSSPSPVEQLGPLADPMVPMSVPGSDCFSTARPRRLTFAAAVSNDRGRSVAGGNSSSKLLSPSGSLSEITSDSPEISASSGAVDRAPQLVAANDKMAALRQRFDKITLG